MKGKKVNMNKRNVFVTLIASALLLSGCNNDTADSTTSPSSGTPTSGSTSGGTTPATDWSESAKTLLKKYCGEVIAYPNLSGEVTVYEATDSDYGVEMVEIYDESSSFTIANYYTELVKTGWTTVKDVEGNNGHGSGDEAYYALTKIDSTNNIGYYIQYFYDEGNVLQCYNFLSTKATSATGWDDDSLAAIKQVLTVDIPFVALGEDYYVITSDDSYYLTEDDLIIADSYAVDVTANYVETLKKDGYVYEKELSIANDCYVLTKDIKDGDTTIATIQAVIYYSLGNILQFGYYANATTTSSWPSAAVVNFENNTGFTVPTFEASEYSYYFKNGVVHISGLTTVSLEEEYAETLDELGLIGSYNTYENWEETFAISFADDGDYNDDWDFEVSGFTLTLEETEPVNDFSSTWPTNELNTYLTSENISVTPLALEASYSKSYKFASYTSDDYDELYAYYYSQYEVYVEYGWMTEEAAKELAEEYALASIGFYVLAYDPDGDLALSYLEQLINAGWFNIELEDDDGLYFEDASGALGVYFSNSSCVTTFQFAKGSDERHEKEFEFAKATVNVSQGKSAQLKLNRNGNPGTVTYSSSDTSGKISVDEKGVVSVASDAELGAEAIITATLGTYTSTCKVVVVNEVVDKLTVASFNASGTTYTTHTFTSNESSVKYDTMCAESYEAIQLRSNVKDNKYPGLVANGGDKECISITFTFNSNTANGRTIDIYASDKAFTTEDMFGETLTKIGSVIYDGSTATVTFDVTGSYSYIGFRSNSGALYLDSVEFKWC